MLCIKFIHYKLILTSAFRTLKRLAFSEDHIAAVRMLVLPAPSKANTFSLWCLSVTHWYVVFRTLPFLGKYLKTLLHVLLTQHILQVVFKGFPY